MDIAGLPAEAGIKFYIEQVSLPRPAKCESGNQPPSVRREIDFKYCVLATQNG
jgi:hypothetical protein